MRAKFYSLLTCVVAWMFLLLLAPNPAHAQERKVTGKIVATDGPIPELIRLVWGGGHGLSLAMTQGEQES